MTPTDQEARKKWEDRVAFRRIYLFFGQPIEFLTDSEPDFNDFDTIYRRFRKGTESLSLKEIKPLFVLRDRSIPATCSI